MPCEEIKKLSYSAHYCCYVVVSYCRLWTYLRTFPSLSLFCIAIHMNVLVVQLNFFDGQKNTEKIEAFDSCVHVLYGHFELP